VSCLLDTNVVSELIKPAPNEAVAAWIRSIEEDCLFLSVLTFAELRHGIERMPDGRRRRWLYRWMEVDLADRFAGRIFDVDRTTAETWGIIMARAMAVGVPLPTMDTLLAATAERRGLTMATRNTKDFERAGIVLVNPWNGPAETS